MPVAGYKPDVNPDVKVETPAIEPSNYKSVIYDDNNVPLSSLIAFVEGSPWTSEAYYAQLISQHNDLRELDLNQSPEYQQYQKFVNLELRVQQDLQTNHDNSTNLTTTQGSAHMYPFMKVNKGDMFVGNTANNRKSLFRVIEAERRTFNRDSAWLITYTLVGYIEDGQDAMAFYNNLEQKSVRTYYFSKDRLIEGLQPFIKSEEYENVSNLRSVFSDIAQYYFKNLYNPRYMTMVIPGQQFPIYDPGVTEYVMRLVSTMDAPEVMKIRVLPTDNDPYISQTNFWSMMKERDYDLRTRCNDVMGLVPKQLFTANTYLTSFRYMNIHYMVYPGDPDTSLELHNHPFPKMLSMESIIETESYKNQEYSDVDNTYVQGDNTYSIIHEVLADNKYVLSAAFYNNTADQSLLEILVKDYLQSQSIDLKKLYACCNVFKKWKRLEQYYYGPILLTLLEAAYQAQYT